MESWVTNELSSLSFGDKRLKHRCVKLLNQLSSQPLESIPSCMQSWKETKAAYRFFENPKVTSKKILSAHRDAIIDRANECSRVFMIQDTTELNYLGQLEKQGVGPSHKAKERSRFLHPSLVVNEEGVCLGVYDDYQWYRQELLTSHKTRKELANERLHKLKIEDKESYRWLLGYQHATELRKKCDKTQVIMLADRESDIYDIYDYAQKTEGNKANWLIRVKSKDRALLDPLTGKRGTSLLGEKLAQLAPQQEIEFYLPKRNGESGRLIKQELKLTRLTLHPPTGRRGELRCNPVEVTVLHAKEVSPSQGKESIEWWLMTDIDVGEIQEPAELIRWYLLRWQIEIFFKVLKSGCKIEKLQLTTPDRYEPCLALYMLIAWRILLLTSSAKANPDVICTKFLTDNEWKTAWLKKKNNKLPLSPPTLREVVVTIAKMGGYLARKGDSPPGPKAMWQGLTKLHHFVEFNDILGGR